MGRIQNYLDRLVAYYAAIYRGANTPIDGGIGVNEEIAVPTGSFPIEVHDFHPDGIEVRVFQLRNSQKVLDYKLNEIVPNRIIRDVKKHPCSHGIGIIMMRDSVFASDLMVYEGKQLRLQEFNESWGDEDSVYDILYKLGSPSHFFPYILIDKNLRPEDQIRHFLNDYKKAKRRIKEQNDCK